MFTSTTFSDIFSADVCPELHYCKNKTGLTLLSCWGTDGKVVLPDAINGIPFTAIAPYAFSEGEEPTEELVWKSREAAFLRDKKRLMTADITEIRLPTGVEEIGRYAFYRCRNLRKLTLSNGILDIGGGALNGCRALREVEIFFKHGEESALKSIVDEVRFAIHARLCYVGGGMADILFPEHYEEAVENTPARILYTSHHGAGGYYRQCFYNRELDYKKYDELLVRAVAEESEETVIKLALGRLRFPYKLSKEAKVNYTSYLELHMKAAVSFLVETEDRDGLGYLFLNDFGAEVMKDALEAGIENASVLGKTDILSMLMDEKHKRYPKKKKTFEL